jgi:histidinol-phosphatase
MPADASDTIDAPLLDEVVALVRAAGDVTLRWFRSDGLAIDDKADGSPVTEADRAAERFLRDELHRSFPDDTIIGEEEAVATGSSGRTWIIDPIDGTKSFTRGVPLYANLLALYDETGPALGVIHLPGLSETVYAGRGLGCFHNGEPARVSTVSDLSRSCLCSSSFRTWDRRALDVLSEAGVLQRTWGDGYGFVLLATGRIEAMVDPSVALWDVAPMPVILREAGGRYTDLEGNEELVLDPARVVSGVGTNGVVHDDVLRLLRGWDNQRPHASPT